jgi:hypothetical protein
MKKTSVFIKEIIDLEKGYLAPGIELYKKGNDYKIINRLDDGTVHMKPVDFYLFHYAMEKAMQQGCIEFESLGDLDGFTFLGVAQGEETPSAYIIAESLEDAEKQLKEWLTIKGKAHIEFKLMPKT